MNYDIRCGQCDRKLATGRYLELTIKCPRCRALNAAGLRVVEDRLVPPDAHWQDGIAAREVRDWWLQQ
ncbi:Com family DNA-binding transcriptional regulator [Neisseriaceae bacterium JH1-16]|nr:Com family DNA-binding transcriptional regulator [Neisseriaceae bacterium JH1-16]